MTLQNEVVEAIGQIVPTEAEIQVVDSSDVNVSWKLNDDPERPNKMSKTIKLRVSREAANDFSSASPQDKVAARRRLNTFLSEKFTNFDPRHNTPKQETPPVDLWLIDSNCLFG